MRWLTSKRAQPQHPDDGICLQLRASNANLIMTSSAHNGSSRFNNPASKARNCLNQQDADRNRAKTPNHGRTNSLRLLKLGDNKKKRVIRRGDAVHFHFKVKRRRECERRQYRRLPLSTMLTPRNGLNCCPAMQNSPHSAYQGCSSWP